MQERLPVCVLCSQSFQPGAEEHVLPNATGWDLATRDIVCPGCNHGTSAHDADFVRSLQVLITLANPAGRRQPAPPVSAGSPTFTMIRLDAGGEPSVPPIMPMVDSDGSMKLVVDDGALADLEAKFEQRGREFKVEDKIEVLHVDDMSLSIFDVTDPRRLLPTVAKAALHAAAWAVPDWDRSGADVDALRKIAIEGAHDATIVKQMAWDFDQGELRGCTGFYNGVELLICPQQGTICARVHALGMIRVRIRLSDCYAGKSHESLVLRHGVRDRVVASEAANCPHPFPRRFTLSHSPDFPIERMAAYFNNHRATIKPEALYERGEASPSVSNIGAAPQESCSRREPTR